MVCKPYQYSVPEGLKYFIACGQIASVGILSLMFTKLLLEPLRLSQASRLGSWTMFYIFLGFWDFVSDVTMLALIEPFNPYGLFWASFGAIILSSVVSIRLASISNTTNAAWPVRVAIFIASCGNLLDETPVQRLCFNWSPGLCNHIAILVLEQAPQLVVQCLLLYLQGIQGFSSLDLAIWCQSAFFTLVNAVKNIKQVILRLSPKTQAAADSTEAQMDVASTAAAGAGGFLAFSATS
jgi:hypothetical protein